jgi:hypothetical protein
MQFAAPHIGEVEEPPRVPQRPFGELEALGEELDAVGVEDVHADLYPGSMV